MGWIISPLFDLILLANCYWPLFLLPGLLPAGGSALRTEFWAIYFLITPHRWATLFLVALDPDRRAGRSPWLFIGLAIAVALIVIGLRSISGAFICLLLVDYLWNAWHFASQHQGVLRMYSRKVGGGPDWLERHALRLFLLYPLIRTAGWSTGWLETAPEYRFVIDMIEYPTLAIPFVIFCVNAGQTPIRRAGKLCYLGSLFALYSALLVALHFDEYRAVIALTAAVSVFHSTEYLAIVSHYAQRRREHGSPGIFRKLARQWLSVLCLFLVAFGILGAWFFRLKPELIEIWIGLNIWCSFLHYAFDGLIWKLRRPATAAALGVSS